MMVGTAVQERFEVLEQNVDPEAYNYAHFRTKHLVRDGKRTLQSGGILPGEIAPDFELPDTSGERLRLSALRGRPVLITFSSYT
jgi:cytochrome oxidase Cu insertion factor (SCO1/SenC/PrrC family)